MTGQRLVTYSQGTCTKTQGAEIACVYLTDRYKGHTGAT